MIRPPDLGEQFTCTVDHVRVLLEIGRADIRRL
jgi:hypothetical protein